MRRLLRFSAVGSIGFCVDAGILMLLTSGLGCGVYVARLLSFPTAVTCTWYANRRWAFTSVRRAGTEYGKYLVVQTIGTGLNFCVYVALIELLPALMRVPVLPLAAGSGIALIFNYVAAVRFVFGDATACSGSLITILPKPID